jgi:hypothetical protein
VEEVRPNITKFFNYPAYAVNHSQDGFKDKASALFGVDPDGILYFRGRISGKSFNQNWVSCSFIALPFTLPEMRRIVAILYEGKLEEALKKAQKIINQARHEEINWE